MTLTIDAVMLGERCYQVTITNETRAAHIFQVVREVSAIEAILAALSHYQLKLAHDVG